MPFLLHIAIFAGVTLKRILFVTRPISPPWDEASKNFAYHLAQHISDFEFGLLTCGMIPDCAENIRQRAIYTSNHFTLYQKILLMKSLRKLRNDFDVLHYVFTPTRENSFLIKHFINFQKKAGIKTVQTIATLREDIYSDKDIKKILFGDVIVTYSDHAFNKLQSLGFGNVRRVHPGIDLEEYRKRDKDPELMKKYHFSNTDFVINFTGEYVRLGAMDDVMDAFAAVCKKIPNAKLSLAVRIKNRADAGKKKHMVEKLKMNGLYEKVAFHDDGSYKMSDIYNLCDVSIFPVRNMNGKFDIPLAVIEAMACEKPVIVSDVEILREFANKDNSVIVERGNVAQLVTAILNLYDNTKERVRIGTEARRYVQDHFDIAKIAEIYQGIYGSL